QVREADRGLAWSPDGRRIAFVYSEYGPPQDEQTGYLMLADLARGVVRPLLEQPGVYGRPAWSPNGTRLAMSGNVPGEWRYALFISERSSEPWTSTR
nr:hypothetical protein [Anaerolineae bacterium]